MISILFSRAIIILFGTLYPAYSSYKAVRTKDTKQYVKWMMYWIVFALFCACETITDFIFSFWFPFYYELKIGLVVYLVNPWTKGSSIIYRKWIHPLILEHEEKIDAYIENAKTESYKKVFDLGSRGISYAREMAIRSIMAQQDNFLQRSYSMGDVSTRKNIAFKSSIRVEQDEINNGKRIEKPNELMDDYEDESQTRTWTGAYDDTGRIIEHSVTKIAEEEMVLIEDSSMIEAPVRRSSRRSRSRARAPSAAADSNTLPRRSSRRSVNSESTAHNSK